MKRGWIALAMIAVSLLLGGIEAIYVTSNADVYVQMLDDADEKMANNLVYEAESVAGRLDTRFTKQSAVFNVFCTTARWRRSRAILPCSDDTRRRARQRIS